MKAIHLGDYFVKEERRRVQDGAVRSPLPEPQNLGPCRQSNRATAGGLLVERQLVQADEVAIGRRDQIDLKRRPSGETG